MNIPQVGQKYKCVSEGWRVEVGDIIEITKVENVNGGVFVEYVSEKGLGCWSVYSYPNDFKLVEFTTEHGTFYVDDLGSKPPLGLQSWQAHDNLRVQDILAAMQRYVAANKTVPEAWLEELIDKIELEYTLELQGLE